MIAGGLWLRCVAERQHAHVLQNNVAANLLAASVAVLVRGDDNIDMVVRLDVAADRVLARYFNRDGAKAWRQLRRHKAMTVRLHDIIGGDRFALLERPACDAANILSLRGRILIDANKAWRQRGCREERHSQITWR